MLSFSFEVLGKGDLIADLKKKFMTFIYWKWDSISSNVCGVW